MVSSMFSLRGSLRTTLGSSDFWFGIFTASAIYFCTEYVYHAGPYSTVKEHNTFISNVVTMKSKPPEKSVAAALETTPHGKFDAEEIKRLEQGFENQVHPRLLERLRTHWINFPSTKALNLTYPKMRDNSQHRQVPFLDEFMGQKTNGFFIESGSKNGEILSNTLFFERFRNWTGLLVEPNPNDYKELLLKHRHSYSINACLNTKNITGQYEFIPDFGAGGLVHEMAESHKKTLQFPKVRIQVQCFTLWTIMKAIGKKKVDLFILDVEGAELGILKTIPFSEIDVKIFLIEYVVRGSSSVTRSKVQEMQRFLGGHGYKLAKKMTLDLLFVKND